MQKLVDGDIAANNGGWQWCAGTGADAAPISGFKIPAVKTKSYDPAGQYIKTWVPELRKVDPKRFTEPPTEPLARRRSAANRRSLKNNGKRLNASIRHGGGRKLPVASCQLSVASYFSC